MSGGYFLEEKKNKKQKIQIQKRMETLNKKLEGLHVGNGNVMKEEEKKPRLDENKNKNRNRNKNKTKFLKGDNGKENGGGNHNGRLKENGGGNHNGRLNKKKTKKKRPKNTTNFTPCYEKPDVRIRVVTKAYPPKSHAVHDVLYVPDLFCEASDYSIYSNLLKEVDSCEDLFTLWHGDSHMIANDKKMNGRWKKNSPTFTMVIETLEKYFGMQINATRFNLYRAGDTDWKPFHHDRAAFTPNCPQNFTVACSFGQEREIGFEHAKTKSTTFMTVPNGSTYTFARDVNIEYKHGVIPLSKGEVTERGRISIIAWGWVPMSAQGSRVTENDVPTAAELGV